MAFTKNDQAVVLNRESLQYLANCIRLVHSLPDLLNDVLPSQTTTYSSYKVTELLNTLNTDLQNYVNNALGNLSHLKKEIVSVAPTDNSADEDTIYLVQDASGGYEQYLKINGVVTSLGSTSAFNNLYTKTESDAKFALLSTLNSLITAVGGLNDLTTTDKTSIVNAINELKTDLTSIISHTSDTDIHITTAERDKGNNKANDNEVVKKTDIITTIDSTSTDTQYPSALAVKTELDKKVDKSSITTTIDYSSTDAQVPSAKSIYYNCIEGIEINQTTIDTYGTEILKYPLGIWRIKSDTLASKFTDLPVKNSGRIEITSIDADTNKNPWNSSWSYRVYNFEAYVGSNYIRKIISGNTIGVLEKDIGWQRLCTTRVNDVPLTKIKLNNGFTGTAVNYEVKNGVCYVTFDAFKSEKTGQDLIVSNISLPKPSTGIVTSEIYFDRAEEKIGMVYILSNTDNRLKMHCYRANKNGWCTFSYPVATT